MKKVIISINVILLITLGVHLFTGCQKEEKEETYFEEQTKVYTKNITYIGTGQRVAQSDVVNIPDFNFNLNDAVIVYGLVSDGYWLVQPAKFGNAYYDYVFSSSGSFLFQADAGEGYTWKNNFTVFTKIVVIPNWLYIKKSSIGIDHNNYEEVVKAYGLQEEN